MPDEFSPDLGGLESDYRIETELRQSRRSRTYLARHLRLNRDVVIQVLGVPRTVGDNSLSLFASDARTLSVIRHPNVVPVIAVRWLAGGSFAVVRPVVRGPVVDEVVGAEGPLAASRVASVLEQVSSAIVWARDNGIVHRGLSGESVRFQQGSGRVLLEMEFTPLGTGGGVPDAYFDARTIGRLGFQLLSGRRADDPAGGPLADVRPDLPPKVLKELAAMMNCDRRSDVPDPGTLIGDLAAVPDTTFVARPPRQESGVRAGADAPTTNPTDTPGKRGLGFGARLVILAVISTAVGAAGTLVYQREPSSPSPPSTVAQRKVQTTSAGGEVARPTAQPPTALPPTARETVPPSVETTTRRLVEPPTARFHEPLRGAPPAILPRQGSSRKPDSSKPSGAATSNPRDTSVVDVCESSDAEDQHSCLLASIEHGDKAMSATYDRLIAALRRQAKAQLTDPDPATVVQLRTAQREWLAARDIDCRLVGEAPLYAVDRAQCYAEEADRRARELQRQIDSLGSRV
jgi:uncharacterized protein YecT (DUF1311 family)